MPDRQLKKETSQKTRTASGGVIDTPLLGAKLPRVKLATSLLGADQEGLGIMEDIQNHQTNASDYYANFFATK